MSILLDRSASKLAADLLLWHLGQHSFGGTVFIECRISHTAMDEGIVLDAGPSEQGLLSVGHSSSQAQADACRCVGVRVNVCVCEVAKT